MPTHHIHKRLRARLAVVSLVTSVGVFGSACHEKARAEDTSALTPIYSKQTGRLEQLAADRDGNGKLDTHAAMDGVRLRFVAIDRNEDGRPDRWEYYSDGVSGPESRSVAFDKSTTLIRAEEANGPGEAVTRREVYAHGAIQGVEEDTDFDGRIDKWETYQAGALVRMDLDLSGRGTPDRRLVYGANGSLDHVERDIKGDGHFEPVSPRDAATPAAAGRGRQ
jgi:hypothetical protein